MNQKIQMVIRATFGISPEVTLTHPDPQFGDYTTNVALQLAKSLGKNPRELAEIIAAQLHEDKVFSEVSVAGPGFINMRLSDEEILRMTAKTSVKSPVARILLEYSCPNPFKEVHTGHMYQTFLGDALGRLYEKAGAVVYRANFGGDVGLHVGKAMWGILKELDGENPEKLDAVPENNRAAWLGRVYVAGSQAYEGDEQAKLDIMELNKKVYQLHIENDHASAFARIYWTCRSWSYAYFEQLYNLLGVHAFDKFYPESATSLPGV
ncbi:MAG TPA: arginine--tRNA ligase, partial [Candidatus Saccharimonadales bacterium]|nr:arginine--tRNA ligase [Candidatus Saccharimonadales bacterium]